MGLRDLDAGGESIPAEQRMNTGIIKVCFFGPESTGKTTMAAEMAKRFQTLFVTEVSREILDSNTFTTDDIIRVGRAQTERILELEKKVSRLLICDTDILTTRIYSEHYLGTYPPELDELEQLVSFDRYFLFDIDVPWVADGLRDLGDQREYIMELFRNALTQRSINPVTVRGTYAERAEMVDRSLRELLNSNQQQR